MKNENQEGEIAKTSSHKIKQSNNKNKSIMNSGKIVLGILASIGVGALIGIVFAPQKGSKTRRKIMYKGEGYLEDFKDKFEDFLSDAAGRIEKIGEGKDHFVANAKAKPMDAHNSIKTAL